MGDEPAAASRPALVDRVHDHLVAEIMDGRARPGEPLRTQAVAAALGVSLTPVREALARLEPTGLVRREVHRGYTVAPPLTRAELLDVLELRAVVEPYLARRACERADPALLAALDAALERQATAPVGPDYEGYKSYLDADRALHHLIARASGSAVAERALAGLSLFLKRYQFYDGHRVSDAEQARAEHAAVVAAVRAGDPEGAAAAMSAHLEALRARVEAAGGPG